MEDLMTAFRNPGPEYRGAPFWAWNSCLEKEELIRQIQVFGKMGLGGFFMHARIGLGTSYLSREWFDCIRACVEEARKLGMKAYLYDEDRWPSGAAGSFAVKDDRFRLHACCCELLSGPDQKKKKGRTLAWYQATGTGAGEDFVVRKVRRLRKRSDYRPAVGRRLLRFYEMVCPKSSWFNGECYLDTLNPEAVKHFMEITHQSYRREIGADFGTVVPGIFTDEPNFHSGAPDRSMPWTAVLPGLFRSRSGRDLLDCLPEIFFCSVRRLSGFRRIFFDILSELFSQSFARQIGEWCEENHLCMMGHVLLEDTLIQSSVVGSAMRFYEYMQVPGIDVLTEHYHFFNAVKQCSSVAHQFGRKRRLSELYGCTGWDFSFQGQKAMGDWQYALGINFRCQHLAWYSAEGEGKRDYPASISYQSPYYEKYSAVEDYFARLGAVLSQGNELCELLVIHPLESAWMEMDIQDHEFQLVKANRRFAWLTNLLLEEKLDFEFGEEEIMARHGRVSGGRIWIARAAYRAVLLPELHTIRKTTLALLTEFTAQGGAVFYLGRAPRYLDGIRSEVPESSYKAFRAVTRRTLPAMLGPLVRRVSVFQPGGGLIRPVLARVSDTGKAFSVFLCNYGTRFSDDLKCAPVRERTLCYPRARVEIAVPERGRVYELHPESGAVTAVEARYEDGCYRFDTSFRMLESRLFLITGEKMELQKDQGQKEEFHKQKRLKDRAWSYRTDEPNVLVLDHFDWSVGDELKGRREFFLKADDRLRRMLGAQPRGGAMVQPWLRPEKTPEKMLDLCQIYRFRVRTVPVTDCRLGVEHPEFYKFELNGRPLPVRLEGWWCDRCIQCVRIPAEYLIAGENQLVMRSRYHENLPGLESLFLLGDFGVWDDCIGESPAVLKTGNWVGQGFPYYAGKITYSREITVPAGGAVLDIDQWRGAVLDVRVNQKQEAVLGWAPYTVELPEGRVFLEITVYGSRRNVMGPFYADTWPVWTGPEMFRCENAGVRQLVPCGLLRPPVLHFR